MSAFVSDAKFSSLFIGLLLLKMSQNFSAIYEYDKPDNYMTLGAFHCRETYPISSKAALSPFMLPKS